MIENHSTRYACKKCKRWFIASHDNFNLQSKKTKNLRHECKMCQNNNGDKKHKHPVVKCKRCKTEFITRKGYKNNFDRDRNLCRFCKEDKLIIEGKRVCRECGQLFEIKDNNHHVRCDICLFYSPMDYNHKNIKKLKKYMEVRSNNENKAEVKCFYCDNWHVPNKILIFNKLTAMNSIGGENNIYCSEECKDSCPTYNKQLYPEGFKKNTSREVNTLVRKMCFERDNWTCTRCGKNPEQLKQSNTPLHCHHIEGVAHAPTLQHDIENVITLCKNCHIQLHSEEGCKFNDYKC